MSDAAAVRVERVIALPMRSMRIFRPWKKAAPANCTRSIPQFSN